MKSVVIATIHSWNIDLIKRCRDALKGYNVKLITTKEELTFEFLSQLQPEYVFFPHWSWLIPPEIYSNFRCVVFHMTDLPFGRGGSPLQNLITRGISETKISAIAVTEGIDAGPIYLKEPLSLYGSAEEIYMRAAKIIFTKMIPQIVKNCPKPVPQTGDATFFIRRTPEMSELSPNMTLEQIFDYIRMLDADGYPHAYIKLGTKIIEFSRAKQTSDSILADVKIKEAVPDDGDWRFNHSGGCGPSR